MSSMFLDCCSASSSCTCPIEYAPSGGAPPQAAGRGLSTGHRRALSLPLPPSPTAGRSAEAYESGYAAGARGPYDPADALPWLPMPWLPIPWLPIQEACEELQGEQPAVAGVGALLAGDAEAAWARLAPAASSHRYALAPTRCWSSAIKKFASRMCATEGLPSNAG